MRLGSTTGMVLGTALGHMALFMNHPYRSTMTSSNSHCKVSSTQLAQDVAEVFKLQARRPVEKFQQTCATLSKAGESVQGRRARTVAGSILQVSLLYHNIVNKKQLFFSDEPGLYIEGEFGIRLETVLRWDLRKDTLQ